MKSDNSLDLWQEIELQIQEAEESLGLVKQKFDEARAVDSDRIDLEIQQQEISAKLKGKINLRQRQELKAELATIQTKLEDIDTAIAAQLITWTSFKEPFWQIVRFSGLGFLLGVLLKSCIG